MLYKKNWKIYSPESHHDLASTLSTLDVALKEEGERVSLGKQSQVFVREFGGKTYYVKQYFRALGPGSWLGYSRGEVEQRNLKRFSQWGLGACEVVAFGVEKRYGKTQQTVLVTEEVSNTKDLVATAEENPAFKADRQWRQKILLELAEVLYQLHQQRFCHNDFQWRNILIEQDTKKAKVTLIDCPFGRTFSWPMLNYRKIKDLGSLDEQAKKHLSKTERLRFYKQYKKIKKLEAKHKKEIATMLKRYS